ncbi:surface carbohydrate biosynthesis protein [Halobacillus dabanensis]|uniref:Surface carbohydrate biosynthesis protein n=1 Tax=Halobacillus dabanensis TaxID=240302 RepID=A0A1I3U7I0_HALDA|nr:surface carbohydrate biosynthesis protein [Halobacillus dabanensis]SFJ77806.1 surface carbohydrate biosynthesis protein [Halobacillus dabanensis]
MLYLPIEIKSRELHGKLLLAYHTLFQGDSVIIGEHSKVEEAAQVYPTGVFLCKGYPGGYMKRVVVPAKQAGHMVTNLDEEGLIYTDSALYLKTRMNRKWMPYHDHVYCWGQKQKQMIEEAYPEMKGKCTPTGNPRFDLLTPKYREVYRQEATRLKKTIGPYILVNTRFTLYNAIKGKKEKDLTPHARYIRNLYHQFIYMVKQISKEFPEGVIIVRPHPAERKGSYIEDLRDCRNVLVKNEGPVIHWLMGAEALVHNGCTTGIEAYLLEKPVFSYEPITSPIYDVPLTQDVSIRIKEPEELLSQLREVWKKDEGAQKPASSLFRDHYANLKAGEYAYLLILNHIRKEGSQAHPSVQPIAHRYPKDSRQKIRFMFPSLTESEIQSFFNKLNGIEQEGLLIKTIPLADRLFLLTAEGQ